MAQEKTRRKLAAASDIMQDSELSDALGDIGDIGGIELPDIDLNLVDLLPNDEMEQTRYMKPRIAHYNEQDFVLYENAAKLAKELRVTKGMRADAFIAGSFIFGDFIEAFLVENHARAEHMTIATLSLSQENVDSLRTLMEKGYIGELNLVISVYFWGNERNSLIPYIYRELDIDNRFQLAVAGSHAKTVSFETLGGKKICIHGSANLRSSGSIEEFTIEENPALYDFYEEHYQRIIEKYKTINKPVRNSKAWDAMTKMRFTDGQQDGHQAYKE